MLKYTTYSIVFLLLAIPLSVLSWNEPLGWFYILLFVFLFSIGLFLGSANVNSGFYANVICKGESSDKSICLSFDDGPSAGHTEKILDILEKHKVKASFFCIGKNAQNNPGIINRIYKEGHILGNHSFSHDIWFDLFSKKRMKEEIYKTNNLISGLIGKQLKYFRPPYGVTTPVLAKAMKETGMVPVGWSVRTFDTTAKGDKEKILKKLKNIKSGDIILFHDHVDCLPEVLDQFISRIKSESYKIVPLNEMIKINAYE